MMAPTRTGLLFLTMLAVDAVAEPASIAYIHGDVAADGSVPSADAEPFHQMLLTDEGRTGLSEFRKLVEENGFRIEPFYDRETSLTPEFLAPLDVVIFGLHQKQWSDAEKQALDAWLRDGGGMLIYSDSASGGHFGKVGAQNPVGQTVMNHLIAPYGLQVLVDQANGIKAYRARPGTAHPIVADGVVLEGEGVSPIAVDEATGARVLIPYADDPAVRVSGAPTIKDRSNVTLPESAPLAALAVQSVGKGHIVAMFDRQPMWNDGPGSDIDQRDNREIVLRIMKFLAEADQ